MSGREQRETPGRAPHLEAEITLFVAASVAGTVGLGRGLAGYFHPGSGSWQVGWLGVTAVAFMVLTKQMARVHDYWPRRSGADGGHTAGQPQPRLTDVRSWWRPTRVVPSRSTGRLRSRDEGGASDGAP